MKLGRTLAAVTFAAAMFGATTAAHAEPVRGILAIPVMIVAAPICLVSGIVGGDDVRGCIDRHASVE